jgi:hypothetical protein
MIMKARPIREDTLATSEAQLRAVHKYQNKQRLKAGLLPIDYGPVPAEYCDGCKWLLPQCNHPTGCPHHVMLFPSRTCTALSRPDPITGKQKACQHFRVACPRRWSDCPYHGKETIVCQDCMGEAPHTLIRFWRTGRRGFVELKSSSYVHKGMHYTACRSCYVCFEEHKLSRQENKGRQVIQFMSGIRYSSRAVKRRKAVERIKKWRAAGLAKDPVGFRKKLAKYARDARMRRMAKDPRYKERVAAKARAYYRKRLAADPTYQEVLAAKSKARYHAKKQHPEPTPAQDPVSPASPAPQSV